MKFDAAMIAKIQREANKNHFRAPKDALTSSYALSDVSAKERDTSEESKTEDSARILRKAWL